MDKSKKYSSKVLITTVLLFLMFLSLVSLASDAYAAEPTTQEKGLTVVNNVIGIDLTEYSTTPEDFAQDSYLGVLPQEKVGYTLESAESKLKVLCTFTNENLHIIQIRENEGTPHLAKSTVNTLEAARDFLRNYQIYSGNPFYGELKSMLNNVATDKNSTAISGNTKLEVTFSGNQENFRWTYYHNGVGCAEKCVALSYKNGFLKYFVDTWNFYEVGSIDVNLSEAEAVAIAIDKAKTFSWKVVSDNDTFEVKDFNVTRPMVTQLVFSSSRHADNPRSDNLLKLYPMWRIGVGLDKFYPGNVYGIYVDIWADTKEVRNVQEVFSTLDPELIGPQLFGEVAVEASVSTEQLNSESIVLLILPAFAVAVLGSVAFRLPMKKKLSWAHRRLQVRSNVIYGLFFGLLLVLIITIVPISTVKAIDPRSCATIWGSEGGTKTQNEILQQKSTAATLRSNFSDGDYHAINWQGTYTTHDWVLDMIELTESGFPRCARIYFDHGIGSGEYSFSGSPKEWHYELKDSNYYVGSVTGNISDYEIYPLTVGKTFFALINTCLSGRIQQGPDIVGYPTPQGMSPTGHAVGMPFAFTHRTVAAKGAGFSTALNMSIDGYDDADDGYFCYMGFYWGSASLCQIVDPDYTTTYYYEWVEQFFYSALHNDISVNDALDDASIECFNEDFGQSDLHNDFTAVWPGIGGDWTECQLNVYGNGNMHLYQQSLTVNANPQLSADVYIDGQKLGTTGNYFNVPSGSHVIQVSIPEGYAFKNFTWNGGYSTSNPMTLNVSSDMTVTAYFEAEYYWLTVDACGTYHSYLPAPISIDDGAWTGVAGDSFWVPEGYHSIEVPEYGYYEGVNYQFYTFEGYSGENPLYILVDYDRELNALYWAY